MNAKKQKLALGAVLAFSLTGLTVHAKDGSVFQAKTLNDGYIVAENTKKGDEGKCGEKCKEGKCGEKGKKEGKCGDKKCKEAKCGEKGKSEKKGKEGKCGEGTCGENKKKS